MLDCTELLGSVLPDFVHEDGAGALGKVFCISAVARQ
jgi:hypothetical protein